MGANRGRPVLGGFAGFFFGFFLAIDLLFLGAFDLESVLVYVLPIVFLVVGVVLGLVAPFGFLRRIC